MNLRALRNRIEALTGPRAPELPANFIDPITAMVRAQIAKGKTPTTTTTDVQATTKASLVARLAEAGRRARERGWS
jgi:hypothetical protein